jgi:acetolactate synthase-1/2/3 large subunit
MTAIDKLAADIAAHGNRAVFGITGSGATLSLLDSLERRGIEAVRTHFEGCAAIMAGTIGRLSGKAGVAFGIKGPGLANMVPGLAYSFLEGYPLVAAVEAYPPEAGPEMAHKRLDQAMLSAAVSKGLRCLSPEGEGFTELARLAEEEVPGPAVLQLASAAPSRAPDLRRQALPTGDVSQALLLVRTANRPVIIAGTLAIRKGLGPELARLQVPVFTTAAAKGVVDETAEIAAGVYTGVGLEFTPERDLLAASDFVIGIGIRPNEVLSTKPFPCPSLNIDPVDVPGAKAFNFAASVASIPDGFWPQLKEKSWGIDRVAASRTRLEARMRDGFLPAAVLEACLKQLGASVRLVADTGSFCTICEHAWRSPRWDLFLGSAQGRYMGTAIPIGIGAAIHDPATPAVVVVGDGGIGMYVAELRLAVERKLPVLVILMADGRFASVAARAIKDGLTQRPLRIALPSWKAVMEGMGLPSWSAEREEQVEDALRAWQRMEGPGYLEVRFAEERYQHMCDGIR